MNGPTGSKVSRGEKIMQRFVNEGKISECGKDWMLSALDPFHDHQLKNLRGWPDVQTGASVIRLIKQSMTVSAPIGWVGNFDIHIIQWPWLTQNTGGTAVGNFQAVNRTGQNIALPPAPGANSNLGGLQAFFTQPGVPLNILLAGTSQLLGTLNVDPMFTRGVARLIGMGFEVHNTTSQLNIQGSVVAYRQMANENINVNWIQENATTFCSYAGPFIKFPPITAADALLLAGSRQWEAKDGVYSVSAFHTTENPATMIVPTSPIISSRNQDDLEGSIAVSAVNAVIPTAPDANGYSAIPSLRIFNVHQNGAIFSGVSQQTTLTINWNVFVETFPSTDDLEILPLAVPSAEFDPEVLDLYSRVSTDLPVAVPVNENGLGDWFYDAAVTAAKYIGPVLSALPHPVLKGIGTAATGIANYVDSNSGSNGSNKSAPNAWGAETRGRSRSRKPRKVIKEEVIDWNIPYVPPKSKSVKRSKPGNQKRTKNVATRRRRARSF